MLQAKGSTILQLLEYAVHKASYKRSKFPHFSISSNINSRQNGAKMYPSRDVTFISALMNSFVLYVKRSIIAYVCELSLEFWSGWKRSGRTVFTMEILVQGTKIISKNGPPPEIIVRPVRHSSQCHCKHFQAFLWWVMFLICAYRMHSQRTQCCMRVQRYCACTARAVWRGRSNRGRFSEEDGQTEGAFSEEGGLNRGRSGRF